MKTIEQLQEENAALLATVEALRDALQAVMESIGGGKKFCGHDFDCVCAGDKARAALAAKPQHHLRERDAEKGRAGYLACATEYGLENAHAPKEGIARNANQYAEQVRRGEVE